MHYGLCENGEPRQEPRSVQSRQYEAAKKKQETSSLMDEGELMVRSSENVFVIR